MAARRLVIVMLILLGASTLAAALVPVPPPAEEQEREQAAPRPSETPGHGGKLIRETIRARKGEPPATIRIALGDQLQLTVHSGRPDEVEIPAFGEIRNVGPETPAFFDLLPFDTGRYPVRLVEAKRTVGEIVVERRREQAREDGGRSEPAVDRRTNEEG